MNWNAFYHIRILSSHLSKSPLKVKTKDAGHFSIRNDRFLSSCISSLATRYSKITNSYSDRKREARSWQPMQSRVFNLIAFTNCKGSRDWLVSKIKRPVSLVRIPFLSLFFSFTEKDISISECSQKYCCLYWPENAITYKSLIWFDITIYGSSEF